MDVFFRSRCFAIYMYRVYMISKGVLKYIIEYSVCNGVLHHIVYTRAFGKLRPEIPEERAPHCQVPERPHGRRVGGVHPGGAEGHGRGLQERVRSNRCIGAPPGFKLAGQRVGCGQLLTPLLSKHFFTLQRVPQSSKSEKVSPACSPSLHQKRAKPLGTAPSCH